MIKVDPIVEVMEKIARLESTSMTRHAGGGGDFYVTISKGPKQLAKDLAEARLLREEHGLS